MLHYVSELSLVDRNEHCDPPDAFYKGLDIHGKQIYTWVEITGAWRSQCGAKRVHDVAEGRSPAPDSRHGLMVDPDTSTARSVARAISKKIGHPPYRRLASEYGTGHLHVFVASDHYPIFDERTVAEIRNYLPIEDLDEQEVIRSVSVGFRHTIHLIWSEEDWPILVNYFPNTDRQSRKTTMEISSPFNGTWPQVGFPEGRRLHPHKVACWMNGLPTEWPLISKAAKDSYKALMRALMDENQFGNELPLGSESPLWEQQWGFQVAWHSYGTNHDTTHKIELTRMLVRRYLLSIKHPVPEFLDCKYDAMYPWD